MDLFGFVLKAFMFMFILKDLYVKFKKPLSFALSLSPDGEKGIRISESVLFVAWEIIILGTILVPVSIITQITCALGVLYQFIILVKIIRSYKRENVLNCNCFIIGVPRKPGFRHIITSMITIYVFAFIFIIGS